MQRRVVLIRQDYGKCVALGYTYIAYCLQHYGVRLIQDFAAIAGLVTQILAVHKVT